MNTKNIMLAIWNQLTRKVAWRNIFVTHNAFGIFSQYSQKKGDYLKAKKEKSCKSKIYRTLLRRERDSNPRYLSVRRFSRPVHSTTLPSLHRVSMVGRGEISKASYLSKPIDSLHIAEREGFEPPVPLSTPVFKTGAFDHSAISP